MSLIRLTAPAMAHYDIQGDGRQAAHFRASSTSDKLRKLQADQARLRREIESERAKRLAVERELASMHPSVETLLAKLFAQVAGVKV